LVNKKIPLCGKKLERHSLRYSWQSQVPNALKALKASVRQFLTLENKIPLPEKKFKNVNCLSTRFLTFAANKEIILLIQDR